MKRKAALLVVTLFLPFIAMAEKMYCGTHLITQRNDRDDLLKYCGEPDSKYGYHWHYDRGTDKPAILVHLDPHGSITKIEEESD